MTKIRDKGEDITIDLIELKRNCRRIYEHFYTNKLDNSDEMKRFLEIYKLQKVSQKAIESINRPMTSKAIKLVI